MGIVEDAVSVPMEEKIALSKPYSARTKNDLQPNAIELKVTNNISLSEQKYVR